MARNSKTKGFDETRVYHIEELVEIYICTKIQLRISKITIFRKRSKKVKNFRL